MTNPNDQIPQPAPHHPQYDVQRHDAAQSTPNAAPPDSYASYAAYTPPSYPPAGASRDDTRNTAGRPRDPYGTGPYVTDQYGSSNQYATNPTAYAGSPGAAPNAGAYAGTSPTNGPYASATDADGAPHGAGTAGTDDSRFTEPNSDSDSRTRRPRSDSTSSASSAFAAAFSPSPDAPPLDQPYYGCPPKEAAIRFFRKYVTVSGRASRSEYWWWILISFVAALVLRFLSGATNGALGFLATIWALGTLLPGFTIAIRRLHDSNRPGWLIVTPYALWAVGGIAVLAGAAGAIFGAISMFGGSGGHVTAGVGGVAFLIGIVAILAGVVVNVVLMLAPSKPEGARFDAV